MGGKFVDLPHRAADYAYKLMAIHVKQEYEDQLNDWEKQINKLLACAKEAYKKHNQHLQDIRKQRDSDHETAMLALSLLAGPALSWIAGTIQYKTFPRLVGKRKVTVDIVKGSNFEQTARLKPTLPKPFGPRPPSPTYKIPFVYAVDPLSHNKVAAKVFADLGGKLTEKLLVNPAIKAAAPDDKALQQTIALIGNSMLLDSFETNIKNAFLAGKKYGQTAISNYAGTILEDRAYGDTWVAKLDREQPSLKDDGLREDAIRRMIREAIDTQRRDWAKGQDWFYWGNNPAPLSDTFVQNSIEAEIWRLWIVGEHFEFVKRRRKHRYEIEDEHGSARIWAIGDSGVELDLIVDRLVRIGVFAGRNQSEMNKIFKLVEDANNRLPADPNPPKLQPFDTMKPLDPETLAQQQEELRKPAGLLPVEMAEVEGIVDTPEELKSVLEWAAKRKPHALGGNLAAVPRPINPANLMQ